MNDTLQCVWVGPDLTAMERLSIASFLAHGHDVHLYTYGDVAGVPEGARVLDAAEVLPRSAVFKYRDLETYSGFSNFFRYKLLLDRGGWWIDLDMVCLRPFDFAEPYVFSSERNGDVTSVNCGAIRAPAGSEVAAYCWEVCQSKDPARIRHGETGPRLIAEAVARHGLERYVQPPERFCPLPWPEWHQVLHPEPTLDLGAETFALHLWNEVWRRNGFDKDERYHPNCLYERLRRRYLD